MLRLGELTLTLWVGVAFGLKSEVLRSVRINKSNKEEFLLSLDHPKKDVITESLDKVINKMENVSTIVDKMKNIRKNAEGNKLINPMKPDF